MKVSAPKKQEGLNLTIRRETPSTSNLDGFCLLQRRRLDVLVGYMKIQAGSSATAGPVCFDRDDFPPSGLPSNDPAPDPGSHQGWPYSNPEDPPTGVPRRNVPSSQGT
jgi:hypothetical protein